MHSADRAATHHSVTQATHLDEARQVPPPEPRTFLERINNVTLQRK